MLLTTFIKDYDLFLTTQKTCPLFLSNFSINLLVFYDKWCSLIGYATHYTHILVHGKTERLFQKDIRLPGQFKWRPNIKDLDSVVNQICKIHAPGFSKINAIHKERGNQIFTVLHFDKAFYRIDMFSL